MYEVDAVIQMLYMYYN